MKIRDSVALATAANRGIGSSFVAELLPDRLGIYLNFDPERTVPAAS